MQKSYTLFSLQKRILAIIIVISFLFFALACRLFYIQVVQAKNLQQKAINQWTRDLILTAPRGDIVDCNGATLSTSYTTYNLFVRGREIVDISKTAEEISSVLNMEFSKVFSKISQKNISEVLVKMQVSPEQAEDIFAKDLKGVYLTETSNRYYPYGDMLTQVLGFTSVDSCGQSGVESFYNDILKGVDGFSFTQSDLQGKEIGGSLRYYVNSEKGNDLQLAINANIQLFLENALNQAYIEQKAKGVSGIVLDAKTGDVLAMSSKPSFNLNEIPRNNIEQLLNQSKIKTITDAYEPGSTFKIITIAIALEEGLVDFDDRFFCGGSCVVDGQKIKCWRSLGHGSQNLVEGFANSCNCVFTNLAQRIGVAKYYEYLNKLGFGKKTGVGLSGESAGIVMPQKNVKTVDLARIGFGHAIAVTPIQLVCAVSSIVNGGSLFQPQIIANNKHEVETEIFSQATSNKINFLLENAVNKTAECSFVEGFNVGGKTGTAQKYKSTGGVDPGKYVSSFLGTFPADNPQYIMLITVDEPGGDAYYGGLVAAPYGKLFFADLVEYLNIEKQNVDINYVIMPDLIGLPIAQAVEILVKLGLNYELDGSGGFVKNQLPPPNTSIKEGSSIVLII